MRPRLPRILALAPLSFFAPAGHSSPVGTTAVSPTAECAAPAAGVKWTISSMTATYSAEVQTGGRASWTFNDSVSGKDTVMTCSLRANSRCEVKVGTEGVDGIHVYLQTSIDTAYWTVNQTISCSDGSPYFAVGVGEMPLDCVHGEDEVVTCTIKSGTVTAAPPGSLAPFG